MKLKKDLIDLVKTTGVNNLRQFQHDFHQLVVEKLGDQVSPEVKVDFSLVRTLCTWVESGLQKNSATSDEKINKKQIVLDEYIKLKGAITEPDKKLISDYIEDLHSAKSIKPVSTFRIIKKYALKKLKALL
ncbi:MAG: hypothetical protein EOO46_19225 [Flavobacterium sp.]|nr:MAG: hypothetical protein EOO46_19225 [Flavobacterium sp.]